MVGKIVGDNRREYTSSGIYEVVLVDHLRDDDLPSWDGKNDNDVLPLHKYIHNL
jgi:hypothetical protein